MAKQIRPPIVYPWEYTTPAKDVEELPEELGLQKPNRSQWTQKGWITRKRNAAIPEYKPPRKRPKLSEDALKDSHSIRSKHGWETRKKNGWKRPTRVKTTG